MAVGKSSWLVPICLVAAANIATAGAADRITVNPYSRYPEGPLAVGEAFYYTEMGSDRVMRWDGATNSVVWSREDCGPTSVGRASAEVLIVLCHHEQSLAEITPDGRTLKIVDHDRNGQGFMTPNASIGDGKGGVYFSSSGNFSPDNGSKGAVLYLDPTGTLTRVAEGINYSNGVALSNDGKTLFVSEHLSRNVLDYDVGDDGSLSGRRVFVALDDLVAADADRSWEVGPDGLAIDSRGNLYIAEYGGGRLLIVDPEGELLAVVEVPERYITGIALGANEDRIFVTAPGLRFPPYSGKVYSIANPLYAAQ
jgi:gluconolactonase